MGPSEHRCIVMSAEEEVVELSFEIDEESVERLVEFRKLEFDDEDICKILRITQVQLEELCAIEEVQIAVAEAKILHKERASSADSGLDEIEAVAIKNVKDYLEVANDPDFSLNALKFVSTNRTTKNKNFQGHEPIRTDTPNNLVQIVLNTNYVESSKETPISLDKPLDITPDQGPIKNNFLPPPAVVKEFMGEKTLIEDATDKLYLEEIESSNLETVQLDDIFAEDIG